MFAVIVLNDIVVSIDSISRSLSVAGAVGRAAIAVAVVGLGGCALLILLGFLGPPLVYATVVVVVGAQVVFAVAVTDAAGLPHTWWAWQLMIPVCVLIPAVLRTDRAFPLLLVVLAVYAGVRLSGGSGPAHGPHAMINDLASFCLFAVLVAVVVPAWRRTAAVADAANIDRNRAHAAAEAARAADRQQRATARLLHDELIHVLRAVSLPLGAVAGAVIRSLAARARDLLAVGPSLADVPSSGGLSGALLGLAAQSRLLVRLVCPEEPKIPESVAAAIAGAVGEALRNVERHAGVPDALIVVRLKPLGVEVDVVDRGRGFDPNSMSGSAQLGYRSSIVGRIADVGGAATITSIPGVGTTVSIIWSVTTTHSVFGSSQRLATIAGTRTRLIVGGVIPMLAFTVIQAALNYQLLTNPGPALVAVGFAAATAAYVLRWAHTRRVPGWMSVAIVATALATTVAGGWELHSGGTVEVAYFAAGVGAPALALVAFFRPPWESVVAAFAVTVAAAAMVHRMDPHLQNMVEALPAVMSTLVGVVAVLAARLTLDRMGSGVILSEEMQRQAETMKAQLTIGGRIAAERLGRIRSWALPFITDVASGDLDPFDPAVRQQAAVLEAAVRDDIRIGANLDDHARALIGNVRAAGRTVEINADPEAVAVLPVGLISNLFTAALEDAPPDRTVLTISQTPGGGAAVSLLVAPAAAHTALRMLASKVAADLLTGPTFLLVRIRIGASMSPQQGTTELVDDPVSSMQ